MAEIPSYLAPNAAPAPEVAAELPNSGPSENVYDVTNKAPLDIPYSDLELAVRSGQYAPQAAKEYVVKDAQGETHRVKGANLRTVFDEGSTLASQEESIAHIQNAKYGGSPIQAGIEGIQRGVLPGISDSILEGSTTFSGGTITQEDLQGRKAANPLSSGIGEALGSAAAMLSPVGEATVGAASAKVASSLAKIGAKAGLSSKIAQAIVSKIIPAAAGSAVEGAYFGAAQLINEDALGTAQFNAENLLSSVEQGALWGAAFGGGLSALGSAASSTATALAESRAGKYLGNKASSISESLGSKTKAAYEFLGITPAKARKLADRDPEFIDDAIKWTKEVLEENPRAGIAEVAAKATSDKKSVGSQIGKLYDDVDNTLTTKGLPSHTSAKELKLRIASELDEKIMPKYKGVEGATAEVKALNKTINEIFDGATNAEGSVPVKELHKTMRNLDDLIFTEEGALKSRSLKTEIWRLQRDILRSELDTSVLTAAKSFPTELGGAADSLKQLNRRYRTISSLEKSVNGRAFGEANASILKGAIDTKEVIATSMEPVGGAALIIGRKFLESDMLRKMQILGKIEKAQQRTSSAIQSGLRKLNAGAIATRPAIAQSLVSSAVATELVEGRKVKPKDEQQAYRNILANARSASENPEQFLQNVNRYSSHMYTVAPKTSGALDTAALNAMVFLHSKSPKSTKNKGFFDAAKFDKVNGAEMLKMRQRMDMITTPSKAIHLLGSGKLGATHVETIKAVYPALYSEMQKQTMEFVSGPKSAKLTYNQKLNMSMLLDVKADESMHYMNVIALQSNFSESSSGGDESGTKGAVSTTQGGMANINKADRLNSDISSDD